MTSHKAPPTPHPTVRTRILILSDTHNHLPLLPPSNLLIHCGDLTNTGRITEYGPLLTHLKSAPAPLKLVIAGNHDITLDGAYYARQGPYMHGLQLEDLDAVREMWMGEETRKAGVVYLEKEGVSWHTLPNGARICVYSSPYQPEFCDWAFPYQRDEDRFNPPSQVSRHKAENPVPDFPGVDLMVTHGPPYGVLDLTFDRISVGCENLRRADRRARPLLHCFGHIHEGWGIGRMDWTKGRDGVFVKDERFKAARIVEEDFVYLDLTKGSKTAEGNGVRWGEETVFVNASIMSARMRPVQKPFLLDVDLPMREEGNE